jgi:hypothetical protein
VIELELNLDDLILAEVDMLNNKSTELLILLIESSFTSLETASDYQNATN